MVISTENISTCTYKSTYVYKHSKEFTAKFKISAIYKAPNVFRKDSILITSMEDIEMKIILNGYSQT